VGRPPRREDIIIKKQRGSGRQGKAAGGEGLGSLKKKEPAGKGRRSAGLREKDIKKRVVRRVVSDISPKQRAEAANKNSEAIFRLLFENSADGILLTHPDGEIYSANPEACRMFGRTEEEIKKLGRAGIMDARDPRLPAALEERRRTGKFKGELTLVKKDGVAFPCDISTKIFKDSSGNDRTIMIIRDLTERKRAEEALRDNEKKLKTLFEVLPVGISILDEEHNVAFVNPALEKILDLTKEGLGRGEYRRRTYLRADGKKMLNEEFASARVITEQTAAYDVETGVVKEDGRLIWTNVSAVPVNFSGWKVVIVTSDITERKQAEILLQESHAKYEAIFEATGTATLLVEEDTTIITANSECLSATGYSPEELLGTKWPNYVAPESLEIMLKYHHLRREEPGKVPHKYEVRLVNKKGEIRNVVLDIAVIPGTKRSVVSMLDITERKQAEEALRESEERFRRVSAITSDIAYSCSTKEDGRFSIEWMTGAADRITGYSNEEIKAQGCWRFLVVEEDLGLFEENVIGLALGSKGSCELRIRHKNGGIVWIASFAECVLKTQTPGRLLLFGGLTDITERKRAEQVLRESESRYRELFEAESDAIVLIDNATGNILEANSATAALYGYDCAELLTKRNTDLSAEPEETQRVTHGTPIISDKVVTIPLRFHRKKDGTVFPVEITGRFFIREGRPVHIAAIRDITERKRAEEALRTSEERYRLLMENAAEAILVAQDGMLKFVNHMASEMTGYSTQEFLSSLFLEFVHPDDRDMVGERYLRRIAGDVSQPKYAFRLVARDGSIKWVEIDAVLVDWEGRPATLNFLSDITERRRAEESLRQTEENFRRSMDESPLGIRIVSVEGETLYANRVTLDIYGYDDIEELRSTPLQKRYTPASYAEYQIRKEIRMNGEDCPSEYEINIIRKTGERRRLQVFRKEVLWNGQKQFQSIYRDITETKKMEEKIRESLSGLQKAFSGIIQVLSTVSEKRDPYTAGHQTRVADLTRAIAQEMGLPPERVEGLRLAGTIHDIGKVSTPAEILSKPSRLTNIEFDMVKSHPQVGHDILCDVDFAWPLAEMVLQHHERMDGSGYPRGLKGDAILLEARILAVADVVEAMASHRPYRPALGIEAALEEIEKNSGILYDSDVVSACLGLFREKGFNLK
jgi:PAS domain S-box-containing protein